MTSATQEIRSFILNNVSNHSNDIAKIASHRFGVSRQTANTHLKRLVEEDLLTATGKTRARKYELKDYVDQIFHIAVEPTLEEHIIWRETASSFLKDMPENILGICQYGFLEMVNNVIDHADSKDLTIEIRINALRIRILVIDTGVGIFNKIQKELELDDARYALLELSKGKLTTDARRHTGEGIFFTSRMFDEFAIMSGFLYFVTSFEAQDWLIESQEKEEEYQGTYIRLEIRKDTLRTSKEVFNKYEDEDHSFTKTHVPVDLARYEGEELLSRSQARRLTARFEKFSEIVLDFRGVSMIGQAFADELFRVFQQDHPEIHMVPVNTHETVSDMIAHVLANHQGDLFERDGK